MKRSSILLFSFLMSLIALSQTQTTNTTTSNITSTTNQTQTTNASAPIWLQQSTTELDTFMSDQYNYFVTPGGNKVWVCTMNLAWNEMKNKMLGGQNAVFRDQTPLQAKITSNLNSQLLTRKQLEESSYYISAGYGQKQLQKINFQVREKFPDKTFLPLDMVLKDEDFISYAYLEKLLKFKIPFSVDTSFKFKNVSVEAFAASKSKQREQVYTKFYNNSNDFLMGIDTMNPNDEVWILKTNRTEIKNFKIQKIMEILGLYQQLPNVRLKKYDVFKMPVLSFDYKRTYQEMVGSKFLNKGFQKYQISTMYQNMIFNLDKSGIKAVSQAVIIATRSLTPLDQRNLILDHDFWIILKEKQKKPYLIIQVSSLKETWGS